MRHCENQDSREGWSCSLQKAHSGPHIAYYDHDETAEPLDQWPNEEKSMAESKDNTELKIGQVWRTTTCAAATVIALGPEYVTLRGDDGATWTDSIKAHHNCCRTLVRPKHELWVNVSRANGLYGHVHLSKDAAVKGSSYPDGKQSGSLIARVRIEFEEGEGL